MNFSSHLQGTSIKTLLKNVSQCWRYFLRTGFKDFKVLSSHDLGAELRMHSFTVNCDTFSNEEKVAAVVPVTSVEVTCSEAMLALSFSALLVKCLMKILGRSALG